MSGADAEAIASARLAAKRRGRRLLRCQVMVRSPVSYCCCRYSHGSGGIKAVGLNWGPVEPDASHRQNDKRDESNHRGNRDRYDLNGGCLHSQRTRTRIDDGVALSPSGFAERGQRQR